MLLWHIQQTSEPTPLSPVTLDEAKLHAGLNPGVSQYDAMIQELIDQATDFVQTKVAQQFLDAAFLYGREAFPGLKTPIVVPVQPLILAPAAPQIKYLSTETTGDPPTNVIKTLVYGTDFYGVSEGMPGLLVPFDTWPTDVLIRPYAVEVEYTAGYGPTAATSPRRAKLLIKQLVKHWFDLRGSATDRQFHEVPMQSKTLLTQLSWGPMFEQFQTFTN